MNSIFNEQPTRKITEDFIEKAVTDAAGAYGVSFKKGRCVHPR